MTKRFKHKINQLGMQFICYDDKEELLGTFADADGVTHIVELLNESHEQVQSQEIVIKEYQKRCDKLFEENQQLKDIIKEAYNTERTALGKSVLKQLMERIGIE